MTIRIVYYNIDNDTRIDDDNDNCNNIDNVTRY